LSNAIIDNRRFVSIVDDDEDITVLFRDALVGIRNITIFTFTDPILALQHFQMNEYYYVLVISDFSMPRLNGMQLLRKMKQSNKFVRTILMTGFALEERIFYDYAKEKIVNQLIQKPVRLFDLIKVVDTQLRSYDMQKHSVTNYQNI
jgi:DNA-binding NtrC family response regulator